MDKKTNAVRIVEAAGIRYTLLPYSYDPADVSVEKIAQENGIAIHQLFKTLVLQTDQKAVVLALIPGDTTLNSKQLAKYHACKRLDMVPQQQLPVLTGYIRGACSPIGMKKPFPVYLDESALLQDQIFINAGQRGLLLAIRPEDLQRLCTVSIVSIAL